MAAQLNITVAAKPAIKMPMPAQNVMTKVFSLFNSGMYV